MPGAVLLFVWESIGGSVAFGSHAILRFVAMPLAFFAITMLPEELIRRLVQVLL
jgi:hypothetical protein